MIRKSDIVRAAVAEKDWKKALLIAKDFRIRVTEEQRKTMARAYECIVHPDFYRQIGVDIPETIERGKAVVKEYAEMERRNNMMKWDEKHDRAKKVIDAFLDNVEYWQEREDLTEGLSEEDKELVNEEVNLMISSIRKRYKLNVRLETQEPQIQPKKTGTQIPTVKETKTLPEPVKNAEMEEKPKRSRKKSDGEKKATVGKPRAKRENELEV